MMTQAYYFLLFKTTLYPDCDMMVGLQYCEAH